ncbi:integrator complex subunit 2-like [Branchiostoma lanceolatum]|uniref:integrator complex subunit 2-like n=1 Tax=Branchiostoma lanceolatum TaxID=7740 RepID=UPI003454DAAF
MAAPRRLVPMAVTPRSFQAVYGVDVDLMATLSEEEVRCLLPCLVRMSLCAAMDGSERWAQNRKTILKLLSSHEPVNSIVALLSVDFHALEQDARKEQAIRSKLGGSELESTLTSQAGLALEFERSDAASRLRLVLRELLILMGLAESSEAKFYVRPCELFESQSHLEEIADVLCVAQAELPTLLPISKVAEGLLRVRNGLWLLGRLVANAPDSFHEVCLFLVSKAQHLEDDSMEGRRRTAVLRQLLVMHPSHAATVRGMLVEHCALPDLAVTLTLDHLSPASSDVCSEIVAFVSGVLLGSDSRVRAWLAAFLRNAQKHSRGWNASVVQRLRKTLLQQLKSILPCRESGDDCIPSQRAVQASALLRLYCALKGIAGLKLSEEESQCLLNVITSPVPRVPAGDRLQCLSLCALLASPHLLMGLEQEKQAAEWLKQLVKETASLPQGSASCGETLLLVALHFHSNQIGAITDLVSNTLGMKISSRNSLARLKTIFTQEVFPEQVITAHAVTVPVTPSLSANNTGYLPIHCILQLLRTRAFSKHSIKIKDWVVHQVYEASAPLHPLLPPLIETYVNTVFTPGAKGATSEPIALAQIDVIFPGEDAMATDKQWSVATRLLMLYYLLLYRDHWLQNCRAGSMKVPQEYPRMLYTRLPIMQLLQEAHRNQQDYLGLYPSLLRLLVTHFPHLCLVSAWLQADVESLGVGPLLKLKMPSQEQLRQALSEVFVNPTRTMLLLQQLSQLQPLQQMEYAAALVSTLPMYLQQPVPRKVWQLVCQVWESLNTIMPRRLRTLTVNAMQIRQMGMPARALTHDDIAEDPLAVLRCEPSVFRCPPLVGILLQVLHAYLSMSGSYLDAHLASTAQVQREKGTGGTGETEREELKSALLMAQDSAVVQILLDMCVADKDKDHGWSLGELREIRCLVCSLLHQMFISNPNLTKLTHFQGYPTELLPVTVAGVPSMHICMDFIPELLSQPQLEKQIFGIQLTSHLAHQFALPRMLSLARLAVNVSSTLMTVLPSDSRQKFCLATLPALVRICRAFPPLTQDVVSMLLQLAQITASSNPGSTSPQSVDDTSWEQLERGQRVGQVQHAPLDTAIHCAVTQLIAVNI